MDESGKAEDRKNVFSLAEAREMRRTNVGKPELKMKPGIIWYCATCGSDKMRCYQDKTIHCAECHRFMTNIGVDS